jgi:glucose-6-phosphate isomerase
MTTLTEQEHFRKLQTHFHTINKQRMQNWFAENPKRFNEFSLEVDGILLDYSKNLVTNETLNLLIQLANENKLAEKIHALFSGEKINFTENRAALHTALRDRTTKTFLHENQNILADVETTLTKMREFTDKVRNQEWRGVTNKPITDIVNIGIGGSHLGPLMTTYALQTFANKNLQCHFISNIDNSAITNVLNQINPESTLFIVSSKSFTTLETITTAKKIRSWLQEKLGNNIQPHFVAVTAQIDKAIEFGIPAQQIFPLWDWVGGRYSIWSAIGLPLALMIGMENFLDFLNGAHKMDQHFRDAPFEKNMPVILALLGVWYINFFNASQQAIIPYTSKLTFLPDYLQQLDMESNGKRVNYHHDEIQYATGPVIFGNHGCDSQHSFFQLLHQGQQFIPVDFILTGEKNQDMLIASAITQAQALMEGKTRETAHKELCAKGFSAEKAAELAEHLAIPGNRPSNILFLKQLNPFTLGALLALYEHKIYVQSIIWGINPFDQWGVELGKQLLARVFDDLHNEQMTSQHDASTQGLIQYYKKIRG